MRSEPAAPNSNIITRIMAQKNALVSALQNNETFGRSFSRSYNPATSSYDITHGDMPWMSQIKSLINAISAIENAPKLMTGIIQYLDHEKSTLAFLGTLAMNTSAIEKAKYNIDAFQYYVAQSGDDILKAIPHMQAISKDIAVLTQNFNVIKNIVSPAASEFKRENSSSDHLLQAIQTRLLVEDFESKPQEKTQIRADLIQSYHFIETVKINYGLKASPEEDRLKKMAEPLFGDEYKLWQLASNEVHQEQKQHEMIKFQMLKNMITGEKLTTQFPIAALYELREELKGIKSYEVKLFLNEIDRNIDKRTNVSVLDATIKRLEGKITLAIASKDEKKVSEREGRLKNSYEMRDSLQQKLQEVKEKKSSEIYHYDPKQNAIVVGEEKQKNKPICDSDSQISKNALAGLRREVEDNISQRTQLHNSHEQLKQQIGQGHPGQEQIDEIKLVIKAGEKQRAEVS